MFGDIDLLCKLLIFFTCEPVFKFFEALFKTFGMQNFAIPIILGSFEKSVVLQKAVSEDGERP